VTPVELAAALKDPIARLGGGFMLSAEAKAAGKEAGLRGWQFYFIGRGGVLGDVHPDVVAAGLAFFPIESVREGWTAARAVLTPDEGVRRFTAVCHDWGRRHLAEAKDLDRLAPLLERVAADADPAGLSLFAGWRATLPALPDDVPARVAHLCHVLREHRGGCHIAAVHSSGLSPLEAVLSGGGEGNATFFGWAQPFVLPTGLQERRDAAEAVTDQVTGAAWARALTPEEQAEVVALVTAAGQTAFESMTATPQ
jgi:hypothetical protein